MATGIQNGENTHHHDQLIIWVSFRTRNTINNIPDIPIPLEVLLCLLISFFIFNFHISLTFLPSTTKPDHQSVRVSYFINISVGVSNFHHSNIKQTAIDISVIIIPTTPMKIKVSRKVSPDDKKIKIVNPINILAKMK
jgi:hypothetical protein